MVAHWFKQYSFRILWSLVAILLVISMFFALQKPVSITVDGNTINKRVFFSGRVAQVLASENVVLSEADRVTPSLDTKVTKHLEIKVDRAIDVIVKADGLSHNVHTAPITVSEVVSLSGIILNESDLISPDPASLIIPQQEIIVTRVIEKVIEEQQEIPLQVDRKVDETLERGLTKTLSVGSNGLALNKIRVVYHDNVEVNREVLESKTIKEPVNRVIAVGNITSASRGGSRFDFKEAKYMLATAYTYTGNNTASGRPPAVGLVAVDPSVIPLGTKLYIEGYGYAQAADTGGSIYGNRLDLFMEDRGQCVKWGKRNVKVYILP